MAEEIKGADQGTGELPVGLAYFAKVNPSKELFICGDVRRTYGETNERTVRFANALSGLGLKEGDKVAVLMYNCPEHIEVGTGARLTGLGTVPVGTRLKEQEVEYIINNSDASAVVLGEEFIDLIGSIRHNLGKVGKNNYIVVGDGAPSDMLHYDSLLAESSTAEPPSDPSRRMSGSTLIYTSGTTGNPKGVYRGPEAETSQVSGIAEVAMNVIKECQLTGDDIHLVTCPFYHSAAPFFAWVTIMLGGTVVIMKKFDVRGALELIEREKVSTTFMVPTILDRILGLPEEERGRYDVRSMRILITGSAPISPRTKLGTMDHFGDVLYEFYGATETVLNTLMKPADQRRKPLSCGKVFPGNEIRLLDENGNEVPQGELGEVYVKNSVLLSGYYKDPGAEAEGFRDGFFFVGDIARQDEDGFYYIIDRKTDMVISGAVNIYPVEIENVLYEHPKVLEAAVIGVPDDEWGESLKAFVVLKGGQIATAEEIIGHCSKHLASYKKPKSVEFMDELPRNPQGKVLKRVLRDKYWKGRERKV